MTNITTAQERFNRMRGKHGIAAVRVIVPEHDAEGITEAATETPRPAYARRLPEGWNRTHDGFYWHAGNPGKLYPRIPRTAAEVYPNADNDLPPGFSPNTHGATEKSGVAILSAWSEW